MVPILLSFNDSTHPLHQQQIALPRLSESGLDPIAAVAAAKQPIYLVAISNMTTDSEAKSPSATEALDGVSLYRHATESKSQKQLLQKVSFFAVSQLACNDPSRAVELDKDEVRHLDKTVQALDGCVPIDTRIESAALTANLYARRCRKEKDPNVVQTNILQARMWMTYAARLMEQRSQQLPLSQSVLKKIENIDKSIDQLDPNTQTVVSNDRPAKKYSKRELVTLVEAYLTKNPEPIGSHQLAAQLSLPVSLVNSTLQKMQASGQILVDGEYKERTYRLKPRLSMEDAINALPTRNKRELDIKQETTWVEGVQYGRVRQGHPEGAIIYHIGEIFENIDEWYSDDAELVADLRVLAMVHDSFKHQVQKGKPKLGTNHHGHFAKCFLSKFEQDAEILEIARRHDDAYYIWRVGKKSKDWDQAKAKIFALLDAFPKRHALYRAFYEVDCKTGDKTHTPFEWFEGVYAEWRVSKTN